MPPHSFNLKTDDEANADANAACGCNPHSTMSLDVHCTALRIWWIFRIT